MQLYRVLAEYYLGDQEEFPKPGAAPAAPNFASTASNSSILEAAGEWMNSPV
jgi:hypothetical protein